MGRGAFCRLQKNLRRTGWASFACTGFVGLALQTFYFHLSLFIDLCLGHASGHLDAARIIRKVYGRCYNAPSHSVQVLTLTAFQMESGMVPLSVVTTLFEVHFLSLWHTESALACLHRVSSGSLSKAYD